MKKIVLLLVLFVITTMTGLAQRFTDKLDRGLVAAKVAKGVYLSWRIQADEYYDVTYNIYRDGQKLNDTPLTTSNFTDKTGTISSVYTVRPVVRGVEGEASKKITPWATNYKELTLSTILSEDGTDVTADFEPNDICPADVDGDGEVELIVKRLNQRDYTELFPESIKDYSRMEIYKLDGTLLWWVDCGPNMFSMYQMETNAIAYDWDEDGRAEFLMRVEDGAVIHKADGTTVNVGNMSVNYRPTIAWRGSSNCYETQGTEYLLYLDGATGDVYDKRTYPLPRTLLPLGKNYGWGDNYGHRANKHFFAAPFLDGKKASIIFCRGIYTSIFMKAFDVNPNTHKLVQRWSWEAPNGYSYQGFHNFGIADVDLDGRDEIVYGSMVVDDNGKGLSSLGRGHGDAQHCGDFDPYRKGLEIFTCHEHDPGSCLRNATTSEIYYEVHHSRDDGRAMIGNFSNQWPGCMMTSARTGGYISSVSGNLVANQDWSISQNMRLYWDGDLLEETFDYGNMSADGYSYGENPNVRKYQRTKSWTFSGCRTSGSTKGNPALIGDILGDWREEVLLRTADGKLRIYTTTEETKWRIPSLWYDHQYRQGMLWEQMGYNQPPHTSFFLGEMEGITMAPPPLTNRGRVLVENGETIRGVTDNHLLVYDTNDVNISVEDGASPYILTVNAPSRVQGSDYFATGSCAAGITTQRYTTNITGGAFTGKMRLIKQGDGILQLPTVTETYSGETNVWEGTLKFDGTMKNSPVWMNRHTELLTNGGIFNRPVTLEYGASLNLSADDSVVTIDTLNMEFGSHLVLNIDENGQCGKLVIKQLTLGKKNWKEGPKYLSPVIELRGHVESGTYKIADVEKLVGHVDDFIIEGAETGSVQFVDGQLMLTIVSKYIPTVPGSEVTKGTYYLYNVNAGKYYNYSGVPASLSDKASYPLTFTGTNKKYSMKGSAGYIKPGYWNGVYTWPDGPNAVLWTFEPIEDEDNTYTISVKTAITEGDSKIRTYERWFLSCDGNTVTGTIDSTDATIYWRVVSEEDIIRAASDYAHYRIDNGLPLYEEESMDLSGWITSGTQGWNNGENLWYIDSGSLVKWGSGTDNYAYRKFYDMPAGKYTLTMFVRSTAGQQLFLSGNDVSGKADFVSKVTPNNASGQTVTITYNASESLPVLCFGIRDKDSSKGLWCDFRNVTLTFEATNATGIESVQQTKKTMGIYDLQGRSYGTQTSIPKGLYIMDGRKVLIK